MTEDVTDMTYADALWKEAQTLLEGSFGPSVEVTGAQTLSEDARRNRLLRLELAGDSVPNSVILKQAAPMEAADEPRQRWDANRFASDWAGVQFLSELGTDHAPKFYGGSLTKRFVLLEDLGSEHLSLVEPLLQGGPDTATVALEQYATRLGRMHADTFGRSEVYAKILNAVEPRLSPVWLHDFELEPRSHRACPRPCGGSGRTRACIRLRDSNGFG